MNREITNKINFILDNVLPPIVRDNKTIMKILLKMAIGEKSNYYIKFKEELPYLKEKEINKYYEILADTFMKRETDLNRKCIEQIVKSIVGKSILDAATGKGYLAKKISNQNKYDVVALDIVLPEERHENVKYVEGTLTKLPFADKCFDTVVCTHALEHIKDYRTAIEELLRVCKKRLIVVVPCQREYKYTFDLHVNFFPYEYSVKNLMGTDCVITKLDNDWFIIKDM